MALSGLLAKVCGNGKAFISQMGTGVLVSASSPFIPSIVTIYKFGTSPTVGTFKKQEMKLLGS